MTVTDETISDGPTLRPPGRRWPWWLLRGLTVLTMLSAVTQAVLAGALVSGSISSLPFHSANGILLVALTFFLLLAAVLVWRPGRGPGWLPIAALVLFAATQVQLDLGFVRVLALHVPLGVGVVTGQVLMIVWTWRQPLPGPRR